MRMTSSRPQGASSDEMRRLGLIRYQLNLALRQAEQAHPLSALSILGFQDSVESFLHVAAGHIGADPKGRDFDKLLDGVSDNMPDGQPLGYRTRLLALNQARINLKHHGNLPDQGTINRHRTATQDFLEDTVPRLFGVPFNSISLTQLIADDQARQHVERAEQAWADGNVLEAMTELRRAFNQLFEFHPRRSVKPLSGMPSTLNTRDNRRLGIDGIIKWLGAVDKDVTSIHQQLTVLSRGIDLGRYEFLMAHTPIIYQTMDGQEHVGNIAEQESSINQAVFDSCRQFVIDTALRLAS
jgi:hypothetical protein